MPVKFTQKSTDHTIVYGKSFVPRTRRKLDTDRVDMSEFVASGQSGFLDSLRRGDDHAVSILAELDHFTKHDCQTFTVLGFNSRFINRKVVGTYLEVLDHY